MQRFLLHRLAACMFGATSLCLSAVADAGVIRSAVSVVRAFEHSLEFEFGSSDVAALAARPKVVGVDLNWTATSGGANVERLLLAGLAISNFEMGDRFHGALDVALPRNDATPRNSHASLFDPNGLTIGQSLIEELLQGGDGFITASLFTSGSGAETLSDFFDNGGTLEARLSLTTQDINVPPSGPSGGNIPEPAALSLWTTTGVIGVAYYVRNQSQARRAGRNGVESD